MNFEQAFVFAAVAVVVLALFLIQQFLERLREKGRADRLNEQLLACADDLSWEKANVGWWKRRADAASCRGDELLDKARELNRKLAGRYDEAVAFEGIARRALGTLFTIEEVTAAAIGLCPDHFGATLAALNESTNRDAAAALDDADEVLHEIRPDLCQHEEEEAKFFMGPCHICGDGYGCVGHVLSGEDN